MENSTLNTVTIAIGLIQGVAAIILAIITWQYVRLTKRIVEFQIEPRIEFDMPSDVLDKPKHLAKIVNYSTCEVENIIFQVSASYRKTDGSPMPLMKCIDFKSP